MISQKNIIVFLLACAFALYQFNKAKSRADFRSPSKQLEAAKKVISNSMDMFSHQVYQMKNARGEEELFILTPGKGGKAPIILAQIVEDKAVSRKRKRESGRHGRPVPKKHKRERHGRHHGSRRRHKRQDRQMYEPTLKMIRFERGGPLDKVEFSLIRRGLITNVMNSGADKGTSGNGGNENIKTSPVTGEVKANEETIKAESLKEIEKRRLEKEAEETRKTNEQTKKKNEQTRKSSHRDHVKNSVETMTLSVDVDGTTKDVKMDRSLVNYLQELEGTGPLYSNTASGEWAGKESSHIPIVTKDDNGSINISVSHGMFEDHFIEYIYAKDASSGSIVAAIKLALQDAKTLKPSITFVLPKDIRSIVPFAFCNKHGLWKGNEFQLV
jgi:desulfoferrodoxin (superoxide reductase-like protein)